MVMNVENYCSAWTIDHCYPLSKTKASDENEMIKSSYWINVRPRYCSKNILKGDKNDHRLYLMQEVKTSFF